MTPAERAALSKRITDYLSMGGLFNPELANHDAVRDLLIDCRAALARLPVEEAARCFRCGDAETPGYLLVGSTGAMIPCPYCHPGKAVEWMADVAFATEIADSNESVPSPSTGTAPAEWRDDGQGFRKGDGT